MSYRDIVRADLLVDEGKVVHAYQDSEGYWSIGVGRLIDKRVGGRLRDDEISLMLDNDITQAEADAKTLFPAFDGLSENRKAVLVNMAFNLGVNRLGGFKNLRAAVDSGDFDAAAAEMGNSKWAVQVKSRADRLIKMMKEG
jgi:lysozyme